jgi:hypothetical protein
MKNRVQTSREYNTEQFAQCLPFSMPNQDLTSDGRMSTMKAAKIQLDQ